MERTTKIRITKTRKRTINLSISANRVFCCNCNREVQALNPRQAGELLGTSERQLEHLLAAGSVHAVTTASDDAWICKDSLISELETV